MKGDRGRDQDRDPVGQGRRQTPLVFAQLERFAVRTVTGGQAIDQREGRGEGGALVAIGPDPRHDLDRVESFGNGIRDPDRVDELGFALANDSVPNVIPAGAPRSSSATGPPKSVRVRLKGNG